MALSLNRTFVLIFVAAFLVGCERRPEPATTPATRPVIPIPDAKAIAEAKLNPNSWVYSIDGVADANGKVPPERIRGAWPVNANGEIEGKFIPNPNYKPLDTTAR